MSTKWLGRFFWFFITFIQSALGKSVDYRSDTGYILLLLSLLLCATAAQLVYGKRVFYFFSCGPSHDDLIYGQEVDTIDAPLTSYYNKYSIINSRSHLTTTTCNTTVHTIYTGGRWSATFVYYTLFIRNIFRIKKVLGIRISRRGHTADLTARRPLSTPRMHVRNNISNKIQRHHILTRGPFCLISVLMTSEELLEHKARRMSCILNDEDDEYYYSQRTARRRWQITGRKKKRK